MSKIIRTPHLGALIGTLVAAALLSGCAQSSPTPSPTSPAAAPSSSPPRTGTPTAEQTAWAGDVCASTETLRTDVQVLVTTATSRGGDVADALSAQMTTVKASAAELTATVKSIPKESENDPQRAAVTRAAGTFTASIAALESSVATVQGASGAALVVALKSVAVAAGNALVALRSTADAIATAAADRSSTIGQAFAAAPECNALTK